MPSKYLISSFARRWAVYKAKEMALQEDEWVFIPQMDQVQRAWKLRRNTVPSSDYLVGKFSQEERERIVREVR